MLGLLGCHACCRVGCHGVQASGLLRPPLPAEPAGLCCRQCHDAEPTCLCCRLDADTFGPGVPAAPAVVAITVCLYAFCIVFAINSAIHSYLIVAYAEGDKVRLCNLPSS